MGCNKGESMQYTATRSYFAAATVEGRRYGARRLGTGLGALLLCLAGTVGAAAPDMEKLRKLVEEGDAPAAYERALRSRAEYEGTPDFDFYYGVAAIDSGHVGEGIFALERVLFNRPADHRARLELARGYFLTGDDERAKREFNTVLEQNPPPAVQANVGRFLEAIRIREQRYTATVTGYVEAGAGYDSNVGSAPEEISIITSFGPLILGDQKASDYFRTFGLGGQVNYPLQPGVALFGQIDGWQQVNNTQDQFDTGAVTAQAGVNRVFGANRIQAALQYQRFFLDNAAYRNLTGLNLEWQHTLNADTQVSAFGSLANLEYPDQEVRDSRLYVLGAGAVRKLQMPWTPIVFASLFAGLEDADRNTAEAEALAERDFWGARAGAQLTLGPKLGLAVSLTAQNSRYGAAYAMFPSEREDWYYSGEAVLTWALEKRWSVQTGVSYSKNDSNTELFEYDRTLGQVRVRYDFR